MKGVRILTQEEVITHTAVSLFLDKLLFITFAAVAVLLIAIFLKELIMERHLDEILFGPIIAAIVFAACFFFNVKHYTPTTYETQYLVEVTDANAVEFNNKYEIIEDKGNGIYIVVERENNDEGN